MNEPEIATRLFPAFPREVPHPHGVPTNRVVRFILDQVVRQEEEFRAEMREMMHTG